MRLNRDRLEMMRIMLMRIHHKSWVPTITQEEFSKNSWISSKVTPETFKRFDITHWVYFGRKGSESADAVGFACLDQSFNREGLCLNGATPYYDGYSGFSAVREFFELDTQTAGRLFARFSYNKLPSPLNVATRIQYLLEDGEAAFKNRYQYFA